MRCRQCGCNNPDTERICVGCGGPISPEILSVAVPANSGAAAMPATIGIGEHPAEALGYATMGERFLASLCDGSVGTLLIGAFLALSYWKFSISFDGLQRIALWVIPPAYMSVCECLFHRTLGKWLLRIQVRQDSEEPRYPSPGKILLRETIGKFLSGLIFGIGFLAAARSPNKKAWHDHIADTVVVRTGVAIPGVKALLVPTLIVVNVWLSIALAELHTRLGAKIAGELSATEKIIDDVHEKIFDSVLAEPRSAAEYRQRMTAVGPTLDEYDRLLSRQLELLFRLHKLSEFRHFDAELTYPRMIGWRREIAELVRKHAQEVLAFDPEKQRWENLLDERRKMMDEINIRNTHINTIGQRYVVKKTTTQGTGNRANF